MEEKWTYQDLRTIRHNEGHTLVLLDGTWSCPMGVNPRFVGAIDAARSAALIREGLEFAAKNLAEFKSKARAHLSDRILKKALH